MQNLEPFPQPVLEEQQPPPLAVLVPCQSSSSAPPTAPPSQVTEMVMYKNRLQEYTQRAALPLPIYTTVSEGQSHDPKFKSTVVVDGRSYASGNTFSVRKAAEQDAARVALEFITRSIKNDRCPVVIEDKVLCKSILHEFAAKMHLEMPAYDMLQLQGLRPAFKCSVAFNGATYSGEICRNKKEAEQLGARAAILSLIGDSCYGTYLTEIIKSKSKFYAAMNKNKILENAHQDTQFVGESSSANKDQDIVSNVVNNIVPKSAIFEPTLGQQPPRHEFKVPKLEPSSQNIALPITFVPQGHPLGNGQDAPQHQLMGDGQGSLKRQSKSKKKKNKKMRIDSQLPVDVAPVNQAPPFSFAPVNQTPSCSFAPVNQSPTCSVAPVNQAPAGLVAPVKQEPANLVAPVNQAPSSLVASDNQAPANLLAPDNQAPANLLAPVNQAPENLVASDNQAPANLVASDNQAPAFAPGQASFDGLISVSRRKNRKKNKKKMQTDPHLPADVAPVNQVPAYSMAAVNQAPAYSMAAVNQAPAYSMAAANQAPVNQSPACPVTQ